MAELRRRVDRLEQARQPAPTIRVGLVDRAAGTVHLGGGKVLSLEAWEADCKGKRVIKVGENGEPEQTS